MWYNSANRDERAFADPYRVRRHPADRNAHVGFGAGGPHFCLGANLARREITVMFDELLRRLPDIEITGEPGLLQSTFIHGIKRMPCAWRDAGCDWPRQRSSTVEVLDVAQLGEAERVAVGHLHRLQAGDRGVRGDEAVPLPRHRDRGRAAWQRITPLCRRGRPWRCAVGLRRCATPAGSALLR